MGKSKISDHVIFKKVKVLASIVALMWVVEIVDLYFLKSINLNLYGIRPRDPIGLRGVLLSPFLHAGLKHLAANTVPLLIFGGLILLRPLADFYRVTFWSIVLSGLGVWLIAPSGTVHIGASGLVFGYFGFLVLNGYFERRPSSIAVSIGISAVYGSLIWSALPSMPDVSWQSHFCGFIAGALTAKRYARTER